jgi:hypothetical protein
MSNNKHIVERAIEAPAEALQLGVEGGQKIAKTFPMPLNGSEPFRRAKDYWYLLGPGLTTGASDDDPSGIATYSQTGAQYGFGLLWLAAFTFPLMAVVQEMCARIGLVTGRGLAGNIRIHFSRRGEHLQHWCRHRCHGQSHPITVAKSWLYAAGRRFYLVDFDATDLYTLRPLCQVSQVVGLGIICLYRFGHIGPS